MGSIDGDGAYQETLRALIRGPSLRLVVKVMRRKEKREKREERGRRGKKKPLFKMKKEKRKSEQSLTSIASHNNSRLSVCCVWFFHLQSSSTSFKKVRFLIQTCFIHHKKHPLIPCFASLSRSSMVSSCFSKQTLFFPSRCLKGVPFEITHIKRTHKNHCKKCPVRRVRRCMCV